MESTVKQRLIEFLKAKEITVAAFERNCGFSNGYLKSLKDSPSADRTAIILEKYPELNRVWLLAGEGFMLNSGNHVEGDANVIGNDNTVHTDGNICKALDALGTQQEITKKSQEQIDRLLAIIEKLT